MRKSSPLRRSARAASVGATRRSNVIPLGRVCSRRGRVDEGRGPSATAWAGVQSGTFGGQRDALLPSSSRHAGQHRAIRAPEEV